MTHRCAYVEPAGYKATVCPVRPSLSKEMSALQRNQVPTLAVLIGPDAHLPRELSSYPAIHLKDRADPEGAAQAIWERLQTMPA